MRTEIWVEPRA